MGGTAQERRNWTQQELLAAFYAYAAEPFGRLHKGNPLIIGIAEKINRTPSAVAMKACNFASLDPTHAKRGVQGLGNVSKADRSLWEEYTADPERISAESISLIEKYGVSDSDEAELPEFAQPTERQAIVTIRRAQQFFRKAVLAGYENRCAITGISVPSLLNASHIIPWRDGVEHRADPRNGIALNVLHDRAFDRGLITFDRDYCVVLSDNLPKNTPLMNIEGKPLALPDRWRPLPEYLEYHRGKVFQG